MKLMRLAAFMVPTVLFLLVAYAVAQTDPWQTEGVGGAEDIDAIVQDLFSDHLVAFEVLGVLLTAAMIGALVIARPMVSGLDSDHYPKADDAQLEKTQATSELTATFTPSPLVSSGPTSAAKRPAPGARTAPGAAAPGTAAPGTAAPGTAAPGTAAPGTAAPGSAPSVPSPKEDEEE